MTDIDLKYKAELRISTGEYEYVSVWVEDTPEAISEALRAFKRELKGGDGLPQKDFDAALDSYNLGKGMETDTYVRMNKVQQDIIQAQKRSFNRIKRLQDKQ